MDKQELTLEARRFFADHKWHEFYTAVAYSGYKHAIDKQAEVMAEFALEVCREECARGLERAAKMLLQIEGLEAAERRLYASYLNSEAAKVRNPQEGK